MRDRWAKLVAASNAGHMEVNERGDRLWVKAIFHDFRRTAATNLLAGGMSPANVRAIVGHLSEEMTARYNKPVMDTLRTAQRNGAALLATLNAPASSYSLVKVEQAEKPEAEQHATIQ